MVCYNLLAEKLFIPHANGAEEMYFGKDWHY